MAEEIYGIFAEKQIRNLAKLLFNGFQVFANNRLPVEV